MCVWEKGGGGNAQSVWSLPPPQRRTVRARARPHARTHTCMHARTQFVSVTVGLGCPECARRFSSLFFHIKSSLGKRTRSRSLNRCHPRRESEARKRALPATRFTIRVEKTGQGDAEKENPFFFFMRNANIHIKLDTKDCITANSGLL